MQQLLSKDSAMDMLQFFHKKETLPPFNIGDKVRLRKDFESIRVLYNKEYPNCAMDKETFQRRFEHLANDYLGRGEHTVTKITEGTPAAGGWFVYVDGKQPGYHGNIFELTKG
jgi:hypothetical protein